jgi:hypothetical protein
VITDSDNPPRLHRAGCNAIKDVNFETKVVRNRGRNGGYFQVATEEQARGRWQRLAEHGCVRD